MEAESDRKSKQTQFLGWISFIVHQYRLIADYDKIGPCVADCENVIMAYNGAHKTMTEVMLNNEYFSPWVALGCVCTYMWFGGKMLIGGSTTLSLGIFLANIQAIKTIGGSYTSIFTALLEAQSCIHSLRQITHLMNLPTDLEMRRESNNKRRIRTAELQEDLKKRFPTQQYRQHLDKVPIMLENLQFQYVTTHIDSTLNLLGKINLEQGTLSVLVGKLSEGKRTLLRIMAGVILPHGGLCFVPSHLRVLHVAAEPFFYRGSLLENLTFGMDHANPDSQQEYVFKVLNRLFATNRLKQHFLGGHRLDWAKVLSRSECQTLNLARCVVANPHMLCMDKPLKVFDDERASACLQLLREFVNNRGVEQDPQTIASR
eukprot:CAMPEP_0172947532 /NCGR_PEP_ID=MMETSP1075-20121228/227614_1 /TAXON_ID=2916 /ORGANISM="Ceratium fusus, Strain PA161109" /LENGTH=372 /DNA_ID=CAMNT_0013808999 /DNA_START=80 /DNA_END=1195 /DNA_ORIENTATION=-